MATIYKGDPFYEEEEFQTFQQPQHFNLRDYPYEGPIQSGYVNTGNIIGYPGEAGYDDKLSFERDFRGNKLSDTGVQMAYKTPRTIADQNRVLGMTFAEDEDPKGLAALFQNLNIDPSAWGTALKNKASTGWDFAKQLPGMAMSALSGIPFAGQMLSGLGNMFEDRQLTGDVMDEYGNMYSAEELNKMNALGGWYTDPARSSRRRTNRIQNMLARKAAKKNYSEKNLKELLEQQYQQSIKAPTYSTTTQGGGGGIASSGMTGAQAAGMGGGSRQATSAGSTKSGRTDGGWGWAYGGRVGYANGGLASLFTRRG